MSLLDELVGVSENLLRGVPASRAIDIDEELRTREGTLGEDPAVMHSLAWSLPRVPWFRVAALRAGSRSNVFSALAFPDPNYDVPMFGAEVVEIRDNVTVIAIDWMPVLDESHYAEELRRIKHPFEDLPPGGDLPDWADASFSEHALFSRPSAHGQVVADNRIVHALEAYLTGYLQRASTAGTQASADMARERILAYAQTHFDHDPGGRMLNSIFGESWVRRYAREFLFRVDAIGR